MREIKNIVLDEERALYNIKDTVLDNITFDGPADGESALKECDNIIVKNCYFNLRYPLWHVNKFELDNCEMTVNCRAAIWYCENAIINNSKLNGIKALRECNNINIKNTSIESFEFGWKTNNINIDNCSLIGEYLFFTVTFLACQKASLVSKLLFSIIKSWTY